MDKIIAKPDWWKTLFDEWYLVTDYRSVCNPELTRAEVDVLIEVLGLVPGRRVLDLCGGEGRHSLELTRRGFEPLFVADYSEFLLSRGAAQARNSRGRAGFIRCDARAACFRDRAFDAVIIMGNSFGYFVDDRENQAILAEAFRLLAPGGRLMLDLADRDRVRAAFKPESRHQTHDGRMTVRRVRELDGDLIRARETVTAPDGDLLRDRTYCERLFSAWELEAMLLGAGFSRVTVNPGFMDRSDHKVDYGFMTNRIVVVAEK